MKFIKGNYFKQRFPAQYFDGIITDIPYKGAITGKLYEKEFRFKQFCDKIYKETKDPGFFITFSNYLCSVDLINFARKSGWIFHTYMIWNKLPTRNWISWSFPLRHIEFIIFFKKGKYKFNFKTGDVKPTYKRNSFGGELKNQNKKNNRKVSFSMYSEIISFPTPKNKIHPTQKPAEFSRMFSKIVGNNEKSNKFVLDPFMGSGSLLSYFNQSIGVDIKNYCGLTEKNDETICKAKNYLTIDDYCRNNVGNIG